MVENYKFDSIKNLLFHITLIRIVITLNIMIVDVKLGYLLASYFLK